MLIYEDQMVGQRRHIHTHSQHLHYHLHIFSDYSHDEWWHAEHIVGLNVGTQLNQGNCGFCCAW